MMAANGLSARKQQSNGNQGITLHHLPALISSYLAGGNTLSKKLPPTKNSTI
jgi:hypothetical protein